MSEPSAPTRTLEEETWRADVKAVHRSLGRIERHVDQLPSKSFILGVMAACALVMLIAVVIARVLA